MSAFAKMMAMAGFLGGGNGGSGGSSGTQSDWNQHDETAPDYVKNRPFYQELKVIFDETELTFVETNGAYFTEVPLDLTECNEVIVCWDGVDYRCTKIGTKFGNLVAIGGEDTGEPFLFECGDVATFVASKNNGPHTVKVTALEWVAIDKKHLPADVCYGANDYTLLPFDLSKWGKKNCGSNWLSCGTIDGVANGMTRELYDELAGYATSGKYVFRYNDRDVEVIHSAGLHITDPNISGEIIRVWYTDYINLGVNDVMPAIKYHSYYILWNTEEDCAYVYYKYHQYQLSATVSTN